MFDFKKITEMNFSTELQEAWKTGDKDIMKALFKEIDGYGDTKMTPKEKLAQHEMF